MMVLLNLFFHFIRQSSTMDTEVYEILAVLLYKTKPIHMYIYHQPKHLHNLSNAFQFIPRAHHGNKLPLKSLLVMHINLYHVTGARFGLLFIIATIF